MSIVTLLLFLLIIQAAKVVRASEDPKIIRKKLSAPCVLLFVTKELEGYPDKSNVDCELQGADVAIVGPKILHVDEAVIKMLDLASVNSARTKLFSTDLYITENTLELSGEDFDTEPRMVLKTVNDKGGRIVRGEQTLLAVMVRSSNKVNSFEEAYLSNSLFGNGINAVNFSKQYSDCSANKLKFIQANSRTGTSTKISNGVTTITIDTSTFQGDVVMKNAISNELAAQFSVSSPKHLADYVMYCLPSGTMSSLAYANMNSWLSVYDDEACTYLSVQMHEIGHNLGLTHSGAGNNEYDDSSGFMGYSYTITNGPKMCFNGAKSWQLGWYNDRQKSINLSNSMKTVTVKLVGVADYASSKKSHNVVVRLRVGSKDYFIMFNRKIGMNNGTKKGSDLVLITHTGSWASTLVAALKKKGRHIISNYGYLSSDVKIKVKNIKLGSNPAVASVKITNMAPTRPPEPPTDFPVKAPTYSPIKPRSISPTKSPIKSPTESPTESPTKSPTKSPVKIISPTRWPTKPPTEELECLPNESHFKVIINTDKRGDEVAYFLRQQSSSGGWQKKLLNKKRLPSNAVVTDEKCISPAFCYQFKITDSGGDGICCSMATGNGSYELLLNDKVLKSSRFFKKKRESIIFGEC